MARTMYTYNINGKQVKLRWEPDIFSNEETARQLFHTIAYHAWLVKVGNKAWAVCPRDAAKLEEAGCTLI